MEILKGRIPSLKVFKICNSRPGAEFRAGDKAVMFEKCHCSDSWYMQCSINARRNPSNPLLSLWGCTALPVLDALTLRSKTKTSPEYQADHHADAAASEDLHFVVPRQQTPADMLSTQMLPPNTAISALFHNCQYPHKAPRTPSRTQPIYWAFWSGITHCCP